MDENDEIPPDINDRLPEPTAEECQLERTIEELVERKYTRGIGEAEVAMLDRVLDGLSHAHENAEAIRNNIEYYSSRRLRD